MRFSRLSLTVSGIVMTVTCSPASDRPVDTGSAAVDSSANTALVVTEYGIGPLRAGMTIAEASAVLQGALATVPGTDTTGCAYLAWNDGPSGVRVMIDGGTIARVDVDSASVVTEAGARVGDSEERIRSLYAGRVTVSPHKYTQGHYLTVTPANPADSGYRIVFETDSGRVVRFRSGRRPPVEFVERCG